ncbi:MAG: hypothetical protein V4515_05825 [Chloroflexota bacterium]
MKLHLSVLVVVSLFLTGCYGDPSLGAPASDEAVSESQVPSASDIGVSPASDGAAGACGSASLWVDYAPTDVATLVGYGWGFVSAHVSSPESAFFNTIDGLAPDGFLLKGPSEAHSSATVYTPYVVEVDSVLTGKGNVGVRSVLVEGGAVGCMQVTVDGAAKLARDQSYVLVLADAKDVDGNDLKGLQRVVFAWPIDASGIVGTVDGPLSLDALSVVVQKAVLSAP